MEATISETLNSFENLGELLNDEFQAQIKVPNVEIRLWCIGTGGYGSAHALGAVMWQDGLNHGAHSFSIQESGQVSFYWGHYDLTRIDALSAYLDKAGRGTY